MKYAFALFALLAVACGGPLKYTVGSTPIAPGADARIVADVNEGQQQTVLDVELSNLPPPNRVGADKKVYVGWYRKDSKAPWSRIGGLEYDDSDREGKLHGSVPEAEFDFELTAEEDSAPASPSPEVVVSKRIAG